MLTVSAIRIGSGGKDEEVLAEAVAPALHREPAELVGEEVLEDDDVDEDRDRQADRADDHHQPVGQGAAHVGDGERQADGEQRFEDQQRQQHRQRRAEARGQDARDLLVGAPRRAVVAGQHLLHEYPELDPDRLVDAELAPDVVDLLLVRDLSREHVRGVAADPVEQDEHQQDDPGHRRDHLPQASNDVCGHCACLPPRVGATSLRTPRRCTATRHAGSGASCTPARDAAPACSGSG